MAVPEDWTDGPAKRLSVFLLGAAVIFGLVHTVITSPRPWRGLSQAVPSLGLAGGSTSSVAQAEPRRRVSAAPPPTATAGLKININTAKRAELELLPGIGPSLADRIIAERDRGGLFKTLEDLGRVRGIGARTIERLREHAVVE